MEEALEKLAQPDRMIKNWIIVFDDAHGPDVKDYFPPRENGIIVITTKNPLLGKLSPEAHIPLDLMSEGEAIEALLKSAELGWTAEHVRHAKAIVSELGYLPVAVVQAGYFIGIHHCISEYIEKLRENRPDILSRDATYLNDHHHHGIYTALSVTWPKLSHHARGLMNILAFVKPTGFPRVLLYLAGSSDFKYEPFNFLDRPPEFLRAVGLLQKTFHLTETWRKQHVDDIIKELGEYSLVSLVDNFSHVTLRLHPLVQAFAYDRLAPCERNSYKQATLRLLVCGVREDNQDIYEYISPHLPNLGDSTASIHPNDLVGIANIFYYEGRIPEAIKILEDIRDNVSSRYGEDHMKTSEAKLQLAKVYWESDQANHRIHASALEDREVAFRVRQPNCGADTARAMSQRARGLEYRDRLEEAEDARLEALKIFKRLKEPNSEEILQEKELLAQTFRLQKRWTEARNLCTEVWEARKEKNGNEHWKTLRTMESLANLYTAEKGDGETVSGSNLVTQHDPAENLWLEVIMTRERTKGRHHPDTLYARQSLAWCFEMQHRDGEAEAQWKNIYNYRKEIQGLNHEATWQARNALAYFDYKHGRYDDAATKWRMTIEEASEKTQSTPSRQEVKAMESLARLCMKAGKENEAAHLREKLKALSLPLPRDREIRSKYQKALHMLGIDHKNRPPRTIARVETSKAGGSASPFRRQPGGSSYPSRQKSRSGRQTASSDGEFPNLCQPELKRSQRIFCPFLDSPSYSGSKKCSHVHHPTPNSTIAESILIQIT